MNIRKLRSFAPLLLLGPLAASRAAATSFVMVSDEAMVDTAAVAAVVHVTDIDRAARTASGSPATAYTVAVEETLKGEIASGTARVVVPGGLAGNGMALRIYGAPTFAVGERALLFLQPEETGSFRLHHFLLGAFHEVAALDRRLALRDLSETDEVRRGPSGITTLSSPTEELRDFAGFARWVAERAKGAKAAAGYRIADPKGLLRQHIAPATFFADPGDHFELRWFDFDTGGSVAWHAYKDGEVGVTGGGYAEFQNALSAWSHIPRTTIRYGYAGTTSATGALTAPDGVNTMLYNNLDHSLPAFDCNSGGVLGQGGPWYETAVTRFNGQSFHRIGEGDVVLNNGITCFFQASPNASKAIEELSTHELGHTLGLGHSCGDNMSPPCGSSAALNDAIMRAFVHDDGRGARLGSDDVAAAQMLYP
ncbi:MAG: hypothetical protein M3O15_13615, partial [Acidobacteriota bacterium]|nr:hypothetical protein [Acidobacteriota bacterium]